MKNLTVLFLSLLLSSFLLHSCKSLQGGSKDSYILVSVKDYGDITVKLHNDTPKHKENFLKLVNDGFYDGQSFHRIIKNFMIQAGNPKTNTSSTKKMPEGTLPAEIVPGKIHTKGMLAAARKGDKSNPERRSSSSQFYIVTGKVFKDPGLNRMQKRVRKGLKDPKFTYTEAQRAAYKTQGGAPWLDDQYTIFGEVLEGMDIVEKISRAKTNSSDKPVKRIEYTMKVVKK